MKYIACMFLLVICVVQIGLGPAHALTPIVLDDSVDCIAIARKAEYLRDPSHMLTIDDLIDPRNAQQLAWQPVVQDAPNFISSNDAIWFRFAVENRSPGRGWVLAVDYTILDHVQFFSPGVNGYSMMESGDLIPFTRRVVDSVNHVFPLGRHGAPAAYYMRVATKQAFIVPMRVLPAAMHARLDRIELIFQSMYMGLLMGMVAYNLFVFISLRDVNYLYYVLFMLGYLILSVSFTGLGMQYLFPEGAWLGRTLPFAMAYTTVFFALFARSYLKMDVQFPRIDFALRIVAALYVVLAALSIVAPDIMLNAVMLVHMPGACFFMAIGVMCAIKGRREAWYYIGAQTLMIIGVLLSSVVAFNLVPHGIVTYYGWEISNAIQAVIFSLGLADRINVMKNELQVLNVDLENRVDERTRELSLANEKLTEMDRIKTNFFANVSHEIRTPLTLILSPVESVLQGDYGKPVGEEVFRSIQRNGVRLLRLINNLLDFSKIEAGRMMLRVREVDAAALVRLHCGVVQSAAEARGLALSLDLPDRPIPLMLDAEKFERILMNLLSNAFKFTEAGTITVRVSADDAVCTIEIADTGVGIPFDKLGSIFDRFSQVDSGSTRRYEGSGIGLALAKEFVELHGGAITVDSRHGDAHAGDHGTTFTVRIPMGRQHLAGRADVEFAGDEEGDEAPAGIIATIARLDDGSEARRPGASGSDAAPVDAPTVLIVEDNPDMRALLHSLLERGYRVIEAVNGGEGLTAARERMPDLVITDVMMPVMNGYDLTRLIKEDAALAGTPVLMLTAKADIAYKIEGLEYGADDYLTKPFNSRELLARVDSLLRTRAYQRIVEARNREIESELDIARLIIDRLLPQGAFDVSGYRFAASIIPMDTVGGDLYDCSIRGHFIDLFIADVSGHGLHAAFLSLITKMALESVTDRTLASRALYLVNDIIRRSTVKSNYVTAFLGIIDVRTNLLTFANAGHCPPLVYRQAAGEFFELRAKGMPLGWFRDVRIDEGTFHLRPGDRIVIYTDGITECMNGARELFGDDRLRSFIRDHAGAAPREFTEELLAALRDFSQSSDFDDDLTLMVFDVL